MTATQGFVTGLLVLIGLAVAVALLLYKVGFFSFLRSLLRRERGIPEVQKLPEVPRVERREEEETTIARLEEQVRLMAERARKAEEAYDETRAQLEELQKEKEKIQEEVKKRDEEIEELLKESNKLVKWMAVRFNKGEYVPVVMWTKRGNPMVLKFVCGIAQINGGWRALLVSRLTDKPEKGEWYPPLDKPGAEFIFRDQHGFDPDDPRHTVLFDINFRDWEEDLKLTREDPRTRPVAFIFGVDEDGNPVHRLEYGAPIDIRQLRSENRSLKRQVGSLRYRLSRLEEDLWNARYDLEVERDRREHLERENKLLRAQLAEMQESFTVQMDETEIMRSFARTMKRREISFRKQYKDLEDEYLAEVITPQLRGIPGIEYLEKSGKEKMAKVFSLLYPVALSEAKMYNIDTTGKSMFDVVAEWLKEKYEKENKDLASILDEYGYREDVVEIIRGG